MIPAAAFAAINRTKYSFSNFVAALKAEVQGALVNEKLSDVEMYLVNDHNEEFLLSQDAVEDAAFLSSFKYEAYGILGWTEYVYNGWRIRSSISM